jgi:hypothetical protein
MGVGWTASPHTCEDLSTVLPEKGKYSSWDCSFGPASSIARRKLLIVGDSFAYAIREALLSQLDLKSESLNLRVINRMACPFADVAGATVDDICRKNRQRTFTELRKYQPDAVIVAEHANQTAGIQGDYGKGLAASVNKALKYTENLVIVGTQPQRHLASQDCFDKNFRVFDACRFSASDAQTYRTAQRNVATSVGQGYIDPLAWMCVDNLCPPIIDGTMVFSDNQHYSSAFSRKIAPLFIAALKKNGVLS